MRRFVLGLDGKPCIWPVPGECIWNGERYERTGALRIRPCSEFAAESAVFSAQMETICSIAVATGPGPADITMSRRSDAALGAEGYELHVDGTGVRIEARERRGAFHGLQTLSQLMGNSPDGSIHGVDISDGPAVPFRGIRAPLPAPADIAWFRRLVDFAARCKLNTMVLFGWGCLGAADLANLLEYLRDRHLDVVPEVAVPPAVDPGDWSDLAAAVDATEPAVAYVRVDDLAGARRAHEWLARRGVRLAVPSALPGLRDVPRDALVIDPVPGLAPGSDGSDAGPASELETVCGGFSGPSAAWESRSTSPWVRGAYVSIDASSEAGMAAGENKALAILKASCALWWKGFRRDPGSAGTMLPEPLERIVAQLFSVERDRMAEAAPPSSTGRCFRALDMRSQYNAPLVRSYWRVDDYYMMHLRDARNLPNTVPFSLLQGVLDDKRQHAFCIVGNGLKQGLRSLRVGERVRSIAFLHAYIPGKEAHRAGLEKLKGSIVGRYVLHFAGGTSMEEPIIYGTTIGFWKNYRGENSEPYRATPVLSGVTDQGLHYRICAQEWVNTGPEEFVAGVDALPNPDLDGGIALFGITAVLSDGSGQS